MKFTQLVQVLQSTYPEQPRRFHVLAARYYLGADTRDDLDRLTEGRRAPLTVAQVNEIVTNR
jgi:hypothetical protein